MENVIKLVVVDNSYSFKDSHGNNIDIWQWDRGLTLQVEGLHLPATVEFQFALKNSSDDALTEIGTTVRDITTVEIPNTILQGAGVSRCSETYTIEIYVHEETEMSGKTLHEFDMPVRIKQKPNDLVEEPNEPDAIGRIMEAIGTKLDKNQGSQNAGKVMTVDAQGNIVPKTPTGGGGGTGGTSDYTDLINKPKINGNELNGDMTSEQLGIVIPATLPNPNALKFTGAVNKTYNGTEPVEVNIPSGGGINSYSELSDKPSINGHTLVGNRSIEELTKKIDFSEYLYPTYYAGKINSDGNVEKGETIYSWVTDMLRVTPNETIWLNSTSVNQVAFYDLSRNFIKIVPTITGLQPYVVPENASYCIYQVEYSDGRCKPLYVRRKNNISFNNGFRDLILSPIKTNISIVFTGDSNTVGYGLSNQQDSWANLFGKELQKIKNLNFGYDSQWVETLGMQNYANVQKAMTGSEMTIYSDSTRINLINTANYDSIWDWYVDDVMKESNAEFITLDGRLHKITVKFKGGQLVEPGFSVTKNIEFSNIAQNGTGTINFPIGDIKDWTFIMIGTNDRSYDKWTIPNQFYQYKGNATFILPFSNHKTLGESYDYTQMQTYSSRANIFKTAGLEILDCSAESGYAFLDSTLYQGDLIHFNEKGHKVIANMVSGKLGLPTNFFVV